MNKNFSYLSVKVLLLACILALLPISSFAFDLEHTTNSNSSSPCDDLVKECFVVSGFERDACFHASATHPFCRGSDLAELLLMRWEYSPGRQADFEITNSNALDSSLSNVHCLTSVDNKLAATLFAGPVSQNTISNLIDELAGCKEKLLIDLVRP